MPARTHAAGPAENGAPPREGADPDSGAAVPENAGPETGAAPEAGAAGERGAASWFVRRAGLARCTTVAAAGGLALAGLVPGRYAVALVGLTLALLGILAAYVWSRRRSQSRRALGLTLASVVLVGLFSGLLTGDLRVSALLDGVLPSRIGESVKAEVVITGPVSERSGWQSASAKIVSIADGGGASTGQAVGPAGVGEKVLLEVAPPKTDSVAHTEAEGATVASHTVPALAQGERLLVAGELAAPAGRSASGYDQAKQLLHQGIRVVLEAEASDLTHLGRRGGVSGWFDRLREAAKQHLSLGPDSRVNEVLQGVVMGDTAGIDKGWMDAFRRSGTAHMLSVSGLHVASLAAIVIGLAGLLRLSRRTGFVAAAGAALLMVPFVGASPPIVRSAAMMMVVLGGRLVGRRRDQWQGLAFAAIVVLAINPLAVFDVGFQLSFSAFAGMLALIRPLERVFRRVPDGLRAGLAVSVAATLGTSPVSLVVFGQTSLISPLANLLVVPTLGAVTGLGMASVLAGFVWSGFSVTLDTLASVPMMWAVMVSTLCARAPVLGAAHIGMVLTAVAFAGLVWLWLRTHRPRGRRRAAALAIGVVVGAALLGAAAYPAAGAGLRSVQFAVAGRGWPAQTEVRVLDVGQGTAVLVRTADHHAALFDGGPAGCDLAGQLRSLGVKRLDLVLVSHPHADHFAGLAEALDSIEIGAVLDRTEVVQPADGAGAAAGGGAAKTGYATGGTEARQYLAMRDRLAADGCAYFEASPGATLSFHGVGITLFAPAKPLVVQRGDEPWGEGRGPPTGDELNGGSIVALLDVGGVRFLLTGDAEAGAVAAYHLPAVDVLVVGHHGSRGAVSARLLGGLQAKVAAISVGKGNSFGHPDQGTLFTLRDAGEAIVRTDESGWVSFRVTNGVISAAAERNQAP